MALVVLSVVLSGVFVGRLVIKTGRRMQIRGFSEQ